MSNKRRSSAVGVMETPEIKRRKSAQELETAETTFLKGLEITNQLKNAQDKQGHYIATAFLTLPDHHQLPDYYEVIELPVAIETIENKLHNREYSNLSEVESDFKRMISNAKTYNQKGSDVHNDAEKIRKNISNSMRKHNPAYLDNQNYVAQPTPIPSHLLLPTPIPIARRRSSSLVGTPVVEERRRTLTLHGPRATNEDGRGSSTPGRQMVVDDGNEYSGLSFQRAQEKLMTDIRAFEDDEGNDVCEVFVFLPSRALKDYYAVIKQPMGWDKIMKNVMGREGRDKQGSGISLYRTWQSLFDDFSLIWKNAREYNEDNSEIFKLANVLKKEFEKLYALAKAAVLEPSVKSSGPKINLKLGANPGQPIPNIRLRTNPPPQPNGVMVDSAALQRQQDLVSNAANGTPGTPNNIAEYPQVNGTAPSIASQNANRVGTSSASPAPGIKLGSRADSHDDSSMPPPSATTPRLLDGTSPRPQPPPIPVAPYDPFSCRLRAKSFGEALIQNISISAHPMVNYEQGFHFDVKPTLQTHWSMTTSVLVELTWLRVVPTFLPSLVNRPHKWFVLHDQQKMESINPPLSSSDTTRLPTFDIKLHSGVNTIEVQCVATPVRGIPRVGDGSDVEFEKFTFYVNRLPWS